MWMPRLVPRRAMALASLRASRYCASQRMSTAAATANAIVESIRARKLPPFQRLTIAEIPSAVQWAAGSHTRALHAHEQKLREALPRVRWEDVVPPREIESDALGRAWGLVEHLLSVRNTDALRHAHDALQALVVQTMAEEAQSQTLFEAFSAVKQSAEWASLSSAQQRAIDITLLHATLNGVGLAGKAKERFNALKIRLADLSTRFASNLLDATKAFALTVTDPAQLEGVPHSTRQLYSQYARNAGHPNATAEQGPWRVTLDPPSYLQFMKHAANRGLREQLHRAFITRASTEPNNNAPIIHEMLKLRQEMARVLGFETFAQVSLAKKMAGDVEQVEKMHEDLRAKCLPIAKKELSDLSEFAKTHGQEDSLMPWDIAYWAEQLQTERFCFSDEDTKPYFPLPRVLSGLFELSFKLFGIKIVEAKEPVEVWHPDVRYFHVYDGDNLKQPIAGFYLDPYSRPAEKNGGAWMNVCVDRSRYLGPSEKGGLRIPVAYLICNQSPPLGNQPSLMTFREVETLFHEFGHGLQHMLTQVDLGTVAGINGIEWDAVELPSQMMENFCYDEDTVRSISGHHKTHEPLPADLFAKIKAARNFMAATQMLRQLAFGALDMHLHHKYDCTESESIWELQQRFLRRYSALPPLEHDRFLCSFNHIFAGAYSAGYYSYKWAEILSCDAYGAFEAAMQGKDEQAVAQVGRRFRETVLGRGGAQHPLEVFEAFRGRKPSIDALLTRYDLK